MINNFEDNERKENQIIGQPREILDNQMNNFNQNITPYSDSFSAMKRKHSSQVDLEKAQLEAQKLLAEGDIEQLMGEKLMFEKQTVSFV